MPNNNNGEGESLDKYHASPIKNKTIDRFLSNRLTSTGENIGLKTSIGDVGFGARGGGLDVSLNKSFGTSKHGGSIFGSAGLSYNTKTKNISSFGSADASYTVPINRGSITGIASGSLDNKERFGSAGLEIRKGNKLLELNKDTTGKSSASLSYSKPVNIGRVEGELSGNIGLSRTNKREEKPVVNAGLSFRGTINYGKKKR